jgi:glycosyltransferase involved in cell wall biosynthesis
VIQILQALSVAVLGGTELMTLRLIEGLDAGRFRCEVSFLDGFGPVTPLFQRAGIPVHDLTGSGRYLGTFARLVRLLRRGRYQIVHFYGLRMSLLGRLAARCVRPRPLVLNGIRGLHVTEGEEVSRLSTRLALGLERVAAPLVDLYVANSAGAVDFLSAHGIPRSKFVVIPNGIDLTGWPPVASRPTSGAPIVLCIANFRPVKRQVDLVEAMALVRGRGVDIRCQFIGEGETLPRVSAVAASLGLDGVVEFRGRCSPEEVRDTLRNAALLVLPSLWEGMPVSVMEAMAAGLPVVGTDVAGIQTLVVDGVTGFLVPARNPVALADRIEALVKDPVGRRRMGEAGRRRIASEFSLDRMVRGYEALYAGLVTGGAAGSRNPDLASSRKAEGPGSR